MPDTSTALATTTPAAPAAGAPQKSVLDKIKDMPIGGKIVTGLGIAALALVGAPAVLPVAIVGAGTAMYYRRKAVGCMTPERQAIYEAMLRNLKDPVKLRAMAATVEKEGCTAQAIQLRLRANLKDMPKAVKEERVAAYRKAIETTDPTKIPVILGMADDFEKLGAVGAAADLRTYAATLKVQA